MMVTFLFVSYNKGDWVRGAGFLKVEREEESLGARRKGGRSWVPRGGGRGGQMEGGGERGSTEEGEEELGIQGVGRMSGTAVKMGSALLHL